MFNFPCDYSMASLVYLLFYASFLCVCASQGVVRCRCRRPTLDTDLARVQRSGCASGLAHATGKVFFGFLCSPCLHVCPMLISSSPNACSHFYLSFVCFFLFFSLACVRHLSLWRLTLDTMFRGVQHSVCFDL